MGFSTPERIKYLNQQETKKTVGSKNPGLSKVDNSNSQDLKIIEELTNSSKLIPTEYMDIMNKQQKNSNSVSLPNLAKRRVHQDGLIMLDKHLSLKDTEQKYQIMENRLKKLEDEEKRAQKQRELAEKKAFDIMETRKRHYQKLLDKLNYYDDINAKINE